MRVEWHFGQQQAVVRRRYISRWSVDGQPLPGLAVFEIGADGWAGITTFAPEDIRDVDALRIGARLYRREP